MSVLAVHERSRVLAVGLDRVRPVGVLGAVVSGGTTALRVLTTKGVLAADLLPAASTALTLRLELGTAAKPV